MKSKFYLAKDAGKLSYEWLNSIYSFNFKTIDEFEKIKFGQLRILNNDTIIGGSGFGLHPHSNMEIVTIPLSGGLIHEDNLGNKHEILPDDVQLMTAGTGIKHSEVNKYTDQVTNFLQIWIFPDAQNHVPNYQQKTFSSKNRENKWQLLVSPKPDESLLKIHQNAYISRISLTKNHPVNYKLQDIHQSVLFYLINGNVTIEGVHFTTGDAFGYAEFDEIILHPTNNADVLAIETPL